MQFDNLLSECIKFAIWFGFLVQLIWVADSDAPDDIQDGVDYLEIFQDDIIANLDAIYGAGVIAPTGRNISVVDFDGFFDSVGGFILYDGVIFSTTVTAKLLPSISSFTDEFLQELNDDFISEYKRHLETEKNVILSNHKCGGQVKLSSEPFPRIAYKQIFQLWISLHSLAKQYFIHCMHLHHTFYTTVLKHANDNYSRFFL